MTRLTATSSTKPAPSPVTFCENVTPISYSQTHHNLDNLDDLDLDALNDLQASLLPGFDPSLNAGTSKKRRGPAHRRRSQGHIPRPPNAFMMFRQNFCRSSRFRPGMTDERDSLSRLLGKEWRELPAEEKSYWDLIARIEKERHKRMYPDYKFKPVHTKRKRTQESSSATAKQGAGKKRTTLTTPTDEFGEHTFPIDIVKQRELQFERNSYITELYKWGYKTEQLGPFMDRFEEFHRQKALGLAPLLTEDLDVDSHSDSATVFDDVDGFYSPVRKPSPSASYMSSPATLAYSLSGSPAPLALPTVPRLPPLIVPGENPTGTSSGWGFQHLRRSSSVPPPFGHWEDSLLNPSFVDPSFPSAHPTPPLSPPPIPTLPGFYSNEMEPEYPQMSAEHRSLIGERRASSVGGMRRSWGSISKITSSSTFGQEDFAANRSGDQWGWIQRANGEILDNGELPEVEPGLFQPNFNLSAGGLGLPSVSPHLEGAVSPLDAPSPLDSLPPFSYDTEEMQILAPQPVSPVPLQSFEGITLPVSSPMTDVIDEDFASEDGLVYPPEAMN